MYKIRTQQVERYKDSDGKNHFTPIDAYTIVECGTLDAFCRNLVAVAQTRAKGCYNRLMAITEDDAGNITAVFSAQITKQ